MPGIVQGVVVQITTETRSIDNVAQPYSSSRTPIGNATQIVSLLILVLDLGLGERGLLHHRPHHRLRAAIELAGRGELHHLAGDLRLGRESHGRVGVVPVAVDAEALELLALHVDPVLGEGAAFLAELDHRPDVVLVLALGAVLLLDLPFDRQAVAVPARHIVGIVAEHLLRARDDVLQDLVERVADMDVAVGVGRAVMQDEFRRGPWPASRSRP